MTTTDLKVLGPIDFVLLEFPGDRVTGEAALELVRLVEQGVVRLYDLVVIAKHEDGSAETLAVPGLIRGVARTAVVAGRHQPPTRSSS